MKYIIGKFIKMQRRIPKKKTNKLKDVTIVRQDSKKYKDMEYDTRMCSWGDSTAGKILKENEHYSGEYKIKINNKELKDEIIKLLSNVNWKEEINNTAMCSIKIYHIIDVLKKYIVNIK